MDLSAPQGRPADALCRNGTNATARAREVQGLGRRLAALGVGGEETAAACARAVGLKRLTRAGTLAR
jgi:hypothetical protein